MKKGLVLFVIWLFSLIIDVQAQGIRILSDDFFRSSRSVSSGKVPLSQIVLNKSEIPEEFQVDSVVVLGSFRVYDKDLGWTSNRSWFLTNKQERELERKLEQFDIQYGRKNLVIFSIGLVDKHKYLTGEPPDGARGHALGFRRGHDGVHNIKRLWGDHFPVFYAGYKFNQPHRGVEYVVCRRQRKEVSRPQITPPEPEESTGRVDSESSGFYSFVEFTHNEYYIGSSLPVNDQRIGVGYRTSFGTDWFNFNCQFAPLNYRRFQDYFDLQDVRQYAASSVFIYGKLNFWFLELWGSEYFVHDLEHSSWDENTLQGGIRLFLWKFRIATVGQSSWVNFMQDVRQSKGRFNLARFRVGLVPFDHSKHKLELGWQGTMTKFMDDYWERTHQFVYGGIYLKYLVGKYFWMDLSWEKGNVVILEKATNLLVDPPEDRFQFTVGASIPL